MVRIDCYTSKWNQLIAMYGSTCYYCHDEIATTIDHVLPYAYDHDSDITNLVPACSLCNLIASDKMFEYVEEKRQYILARRKQYRNRRGICTECLMPYSYRVHSPSLFLCAECYDREYNTKWAARKQWIRWLSELRDAGIYPEAHRDARRRYGPAIKRYSKVFLDVIAEGYQKIMDAKGIVVR